MKINGKNYNLDSAQGVVYFDKSIECYENFKIFYDYLFIKIQYTIFILFNHFKEFNLNYFYKL